MGEDESVREGEALDTEEVAADSAATPTRAQGNRRTRRSRRLSALRETVVVLASALVLSLLIKTFLAQAFLIPSPSMESTLEPGDRVLASLLAPGPLDVNRGDVVVFVDPGGWLSSETAPVGGHLALQQALEFVGLLPQNTGEHLIKRVIAMGGDTVECCDEAGRILVNGVAIDEPYIIAGAAPSETPFSYTVPADHLFVLGDNRPNSGDSRYNPGSPGGGMVPMSNVVGVAMVTIWPLDRVTLLRNPGATFESVPDAG